MTSLTPAANALQKPRFWTLPKIVAVGMGLAAFAAIAFWVQITLEVDSLTRPPRMEVLAPPASSALGIPNAVSFLTTDGLTIRGWFVDTRNGATIVLCHGHGQNRSQLLAEAEYLVHFGFGVLMFDWRAHGESDGAVSTRGDRERFDLLAALDFLGKRYADRPVKLGALGFSRGGSVVLQVAAADNRIQAIVVQAAAASLEESLIADISGPAVLSRWPALLAARLSGIDVTGFRPIDRITALSPRPVFIMQGTDDPWVRTHVAERLYAAAGEPKQLWLVKGAGHGGFTQAAGDEYRSRLVKFFEDSLLGGQPTGASAVTRQAAFSADGAPK